MDQPNTRGILVFSIVWWLGTPGPSTRVCSVYTAIRFLLNSSMAVTDWTSSWYGRRVSTMGLSLSRPIQSGMLVYCSCSPLRLWQTLDTRPSSVPSSQPWKPTMILIMVIIYIIAIIHIMHIIILCNIITIMHVIAIMLIIACSSVKDGWNL